MIKFRNIASIGLFIVMAIVFCFGFQTKEVSAYGYADALLVDFSGKWSNDYYLTETNDEHWYKIVVPEDGKVQIKLMHYMWNIYTALYNADFSNNIENESFYMGTETTPETDTINFELSSGTYYFKITGDNGRYKMNWTYLSYQTKDANALSYDHPQIFLTGEKMIGALTYTDKEDWYKINILKDSRYILKITHYMDNIYYEMYNEDLSKMVSTGSYYKGDEFSPEVDLDEIVLSAGTYYLKITGVRGKYILDLNQLSQTNCNHEYATKTVSSTYFNKGYDLHICIKCGKSYKDNYVSKKKLGQSTISVYSYGGKRKIYLQWYTVSDASGYQIRYCKSKAMKKGLKIKTIKGRTKNNKTIKRLSKKKYYVQVRAYKKLGTKTVYGKWSSKICIKCGKSYKDNYVSKKKLGQSTISVYSYGGKRKIYLQWYTVSDASGYQIRYCKSKAMKKGLKIKTIKGRTKNNKTIKRLSKKKYYVQVRAYKKLGTKTVYGKWSSKKSLKTR